MRRLFRRLFTVCSATSLVVCMATAAAPDAAQPTSLADESRRLADLKAAEFQRLRAVFAIKDADEQPHSRSAAKRMVALREIADLRLPASVDMLAAAYAAPPNYDEPWRVRLQLI